MQMKNMCIVPCIHTANEKHDSSALYILTANEKHEHSALHTYLMQMKNMSIVPCIHTYCK